jgi:hypothetical protein
MNNIPQISAPFCPDLSQPEEEGQRLRDAYSKARVILEYGAGGSTVAASEMVNKLIFSVESDQKWAHNLQHYVDSQNMPSPVIMHFMGPTYRFKGMAKISSLSFRHLGSAVFSSSRCCSH